MNNDLEKRSKIVKYEIGQSVKIAVTDVIGMVTRYLISELELQYEVCYPDQDNQPVKRWFNQIELEEINSQKFGFGG